MRNRMILSILATMALLYYGLPQLSLSGGGIEQVFSLIWLAFAMIAIGGNLAQFLYEPVKDKQKQKSVATTNKEVIARMRVRG